VIRAMDGSAPPRDAENARERCAALIRLLEAQQHAFADALGELRRIDRELREQNRLRLF